MTKIILERHGQSMANIDGTFAGNTDADLAETGHAQAEKAAEYIAENIKIDKIYSSDLKRAYKTAKHAAEKLGLEITTVKELREIDAGEWEGLTLDKMKEDYPEETWAWRNDIGKVCCPGGESTAQLSERIYKALVKIAAENDGKTILVTTHATPIRVVACRAMGIPVEDLQSVRWVTNASLTIIDFEGEKMKLEKYGYDEFMGDLVTKLIL